MTAVETRPAAALSTRADAEHRAERIRAGIVTIAAWQIDVITAHRQRDWIALGYNGWDSYLAGEYAEARVAVSREQRREIVADMRQAGMSTRAIGSALGVSEATARRASNDAGARNHAPAPADDPAQPPAPITGLDGKIYRASVPRREPQPEPTVAEQVADTEQWWAEQAERLTANGTVDRLNAERPYGLAVVGLSHAAEQITATGHDPHDLGRHIPPSTRGDVDGIRAAHEWLGAFLAAADRTEASA